MHGHADKLATSVARCSVTGLPTTMLQAHTLSLSPFPTQPTHHPYLTALLAVRDPSCPTYPPHTSTTLESKVLLTALLALPTLLHPYCCPLDMHSPLGTHPIPPYSPLGSRELLTALLAFPTLLPLPLSS